MRHNPGHFEFRSRFDAGLYAATNRAALGAGHLQAKRPQRISFGGIVTGRSNAGGVQAVQWSLQG